MLGNGGAFCWNLSNLTEICMQKHYLYASPMPLSPGQHLGWLLKYAVRVFLSLWHLNALSRCPEFPKHFCPVPPKGTVPFPPPLKRPGPVPFSCHPCRALVPSLSLSGWHAAWRTLLYCFQDSFFTLTSSTLAKRQNTDHVSPNSTKGSSISVQCYFPSDGNTTASVRVGCEMKAPDTLSKHLF